MAISRLCSIPDCDKPHGARGLCAGHSWRLKKYGDPHHGGPLKKYGLPKAYLYNVVLSYNGDGCLTWPFTVTSHGYGIVPIDGHQHMVPRLVCEAEHGAAPTDTHEAAHTCGNGHLRCVSRRHLRWATPSENARDKIKHGTHNRGERHSLVKLTEDQVIAIRQLQGSKSQRKIAAQFGVTRRTVEDIFSRRNWGWLPETAISAATD